ncbi:disease resistance protein At4g27190-like isoform X5 [Carya illinoinensis]|uniref:disease resistance protein At4g27190-like isoform X5 n=1 Tax=Carya illinoinensis TaxID=32201 RepID=UPI001C71AA5B|nr:disease resistance protein At4g27190-like isoform X5 [Carya illinoinensis]
MAENIVISVVAKIAEYTVAPVGRWLCYSFHFNSNIENLKNQEKNLRDAKDRVQHSVDVALRNEEEIYPAISKWLIDVDRIIELATRRLCESEEEAGTGSSNAACLNIKQRHQLSQEAKKIVENIAQLFAELHNNRNFEKVSHPTLPSEGMDYNNIENLKKQLEKLQHARERVRHSVDAALRNGEEIYSDVSKWLTDVDRITELATKTLCESEEEASTRSSNAACLNLQQRHQISREAKKMAGDIAELLKNGKFDRVAHHPPSQNMAPEQNEDYITLGSRMSVMKRIMEALGDANIKKIGVSGLAGVGKSTLMEEICRQVKEKRLFDEVALAKVTDSPNLSRIREEIAEMLNLQFNSNETEIGRANRLRTRLKKDNEILVILDDIWKQLDLNAIGIPSRGCKLLLTSRDQRVLASHMGTEKNIELDILGEEEAWTLFEKMAGVSFKDDPDLQNEAIKVAKECAGLPIALVTVSRALKDHKSLRIWKDALVQLRRPPSEHDTEIWSPVYSCIELSYKHLVGKEVKSLFLLCAQQGYVISYRDLLRYSFGLRLFHGIDTLEEASNRLEKLVSNLQDSCLLIQSPHSSNEFYMHDVVRHVATMIASNDHNMFVMRGNGGQTAWPYVDALKKCEALSIRGAHHIHKYPNKIECPKLRYFHVQSPYLKPPSSTSFQGMDKLEDIFFQGMDKLEVLSLKNIQLSSLLPLTNLQTLCLDRCTLGDIHWIGKLKTLVILSLARSDISNLPREIESLTRLQLLDLSYCFRLRVIPPNVLSSLVDLEELYMRKIKVEWEVEGPSNEGKNASLAELKKLSHLTTLEIDILNANNLPANLFSEKLERYKICIGDTWPWETLFKEEAFSIMLKLKLNMSFQLDFGIKMLLKRTEYLYLDESNSSKSVLYELHREDFQQLKHLHIQNNGNIKHIPELRTPDVAFPILEVFFLKNMFSLEEICQGKLPLLSFKNLKVLVVENCEKLRFIFSSSIARGLSLLEELNITRCNNMGAIFVKEEEDGIEDQGDTMLFGRLQTLVLKYLPKLVGFLSTKDSFMADCRETNSEGNHDLQLPLLHHDQLSFPSLKMLDIWKMDKLEIIWQDQVAATSFPNIQELKIFCCKKLLHVFHSNLHTTTTTLIHSLTNLDISYCSSLETIFGNMEGQNGKEPQVLMAPSSGTEESVAREDGTARHIEFPILTRLSLIALPKLKWIFEGVHTNLESWPSLKELSLGKCGEQVNKMIWASKFASSSSSQENQLQTCIQQPMFVVEKGTFPNLEHLLLVFRRITIRPSRFSDFPDPSFLLTRLPNLLKLNVYDSVWEEIFPYELVDREIRLRRLTLCRLRMLTHLWKEDSTQPCQLFHNLQYLDVSRCGKLKNLVPSSVSLRNLTGLEISHCHGLINLLTSSTAKTLVQLQRMTVIDCKRITEIVAMEDGEANVAITFNKLTRLTLDGLPNLTHFCSGPYSFGFPSLDEVIVRCCLEMKTFSHGVLSTPKLTAIYDDNRWSSKLNLHWKDDLNTTTRCLWEESNQYDTRLLFRERVENFEKDEDHP